MPCDHLGFRRFLSNIGALAGRRGGGCGRESESVRRAVCLAGRGFAGFLCAGVGGGCFLAAGAGKNGDIVEAGGGETPKRTKF